MQVAIQTVQMNWICRLGIYLMHVMWWMCNGCCDGLAVSLCWPVTACVCAISVLSRQSEVWCGTSHRFPCLNVASFEEGNRSGNTAAVNITVGNMGTCSLWALDAVMSTNVRFVKVFQLLYISVVAPVAESWQRERERRRWFWVSVIRTPLYNI